MKLIIQFKIFVTIHISLCKWKWISFHENVSKSCLLSILGNAFNLSYKI